MAPTRIYVGIVNYVGIVLLVSWNYFLLAPTQISLGNDGILSKKKYPAARLHDCGLFSYETWVSCKIMPEA